MNVLCFFNLNRESTALALQFSITIFYKGLSEKKNLQLFLYESDLKHCINVVHYKVTCNACKGHSLHIMFSEFGRIVDSWKSYYS